MKPSTSSTSRKRARLSPIDEPSPTESNAANKSPQPSELSPDFTTASSFRNVSACNRCRQRKNRCDQKLPACSSCEKAGIKCVGFDQITKREIPRTYVYYLESRVSYLESQLDRYEIEYAPSKVFDPGAKSILGLSNGQSESAERSLASGNAATERGQTIKGQERDKDYTLNKLVSNIGMVSLKGASDPRFLGSTSGISFARVVFAAVKSSISSTASEKGGSRSAKPGSTGPAGANGTSMRESFFGLHTRPTFKQAPFPDKKLGRSLVDLYFEHANPQIPILHREEFMALFEKAYASKDRQRSSRELYLLNIVFAIGAGIFFEGSNTSSYSDSPWAPEYSSIGQNSKMQKISQQRQPEEYHSSAMMHLESCLGSGPSSDYSEGFGSGLVELQAVLLLAGFALLRPVAPGLWYIVGVAVRLAVDLGLHCDDGMAVGGNENITGVAKSEAIVVETSGCLPDTRAVDEKERGRREWVCDLRRRLWWCAYSFDRLVSICVGRPFGIADQAITTEFPSMLDDANITTSGFKMPPEDFNGPSYKRVSYHYFRLRLLQSEILQVLQYRQTQMAHVSHRTRGNQYMHTKLSSPFLQGFDSFYAWRKDIDRRLWDWKESAPLQQDTTVQFSVEFLELNYWQAVVMLYRQSLSVPSPLAGETSPSEEVSSPMSLNTEDHEDEEEVFLKVAEAGQRVLKLYRQLHRVHLVNYTYLATVHLFMAGIAFLYAIWHSQTVRSLLTLDDVDFTVLSATSVLEDLVDKCPPAEACHDAFVRMSKATVTMCLSTTGFGSRAPTSDLHLTSNQEEKKAGPAHEFDISDFSSQPQRQFGASSRPSVQFDMNLRDLFPDQTQDGRPFGSNLGRWQGLLRSDDLSSAYLVGQPSLPYLRHDGLNNLPHHVPQKHENNTIYGNPGPGQPTALDEGMGPMTYDNNHNNNDNVTSNNVYGLPGRNSHETTALANSLTNSEHLDENMSFYGDPSRLNLGHVDDCRYNYGDGTQVDLFDGFFFGNVGNNCSGTG